ncbi:uncharacterized protein MELLADRAFT_109231 [Melampsora larici-populina 98AG31]|uniref:Secreted protein n=1 Tax=Melampsora larici-populina (strain 98AG31 / pathotype 3-4-7) TaxID=747676 RepID=F4RVT3_MELLP|nr:uncharacterized protein MELLADRAFT_109231 [Melampsora larici-populina 98AG31]EGG03528.1 secreted protein [Melampsora larici-populina 98AG31]
MKFCLSIFLALTILSTVFCSRLPNPANDTVNTTLSKILPSSDHHTKLIESRAIVNPPNTTVEELISCNPRNSKRPENKANLKDIKTAIASMQRRGGPCEMAGGCAMKECVNSSVIELCPFDEGRVSLTCSVVAEIAERIVNKCQTKNSQLVSGTYFDEITFWQVSAYKIKNAC